MFKIRLFIHHVISPDCWTYLLPGQAPDNPSEPLAEADYLRRKQSPLLCVPASFLRTQHETNNGTGVGSRFATRQPTHWVRLTFHPRLRCGHYWLHICTAREPSCESHAGYPRSGMANTDQSKQPEHLPRRCGHRAVSGHLTAGRLLMWLRCIPSRLHTVGGQLRHTRRPGRF